MTVKANHGGFENCSYSIKTSFTSVPLKALLKILIIEESDLLCERKMLRILNYSHYLIELNSLV